MKQFLTFLLCLVTSLTAGAAPTTPTFSTEDGVATWYYIRFKSNYNCYLTDCGAGNNVQVLGYDPARTADQQWKVVGESTNSITLVSKAGHKLYYNSSTYRYVTSDTEANTYKLYAYASYWEMSRTEVSETAMRFGISGSICFHGAVITEKNPNNDLNKFDFVPVATAQANYNTFKSKLPMLSDEEEPVWYYLSLTKDATHYLVDNGASTKVALSSTETVNDKARQWQLVPVDNEGGFALRSRLGHYITSFTKVVNNIATAGDKDNGRYYTGAASATINDAIVFCLGSGNTVNDFEIYRKGDSNKWGFNKRGGSEVGLWNEFDGGNKMACVEVVNFDNAFIPSLPKFSDGKNAYWYFLRMPNRNTYIKAASTDTKLELAASATNSDAFKWKFIGTKDNFIMVSKDGKYVCGLDAENTGTARFQLGTESASAQAFYFDPCGDYVEIVRVGDSDKRGMNDRSVNDPAGLGIWDNDDACNRIQFFAVDIVASSAELTGATYYYMQFKKGGAVVEDKGAGTNAQTATLANNKNEQLWAFIGTNHTSLKAINKAGHYLSYNGTNYQTVADEDDAVTFELRQSTAHPGYFELVNANATQAMNQVGGAGAGRNLGVYTIGDDNNPFKVVLSAAPMEPIFYNDAVAADGDEWYIMQFCNGSLNWVAPSTVGGQVTVTKSLLDKEEDMMWRFVGTKNEFKLVNKKGQYAYFHDNFLKTSESVDNNNADAYKFSLVVSAGAYLQAWEIKPAVVNGTDYLNMYQGAYEGKPISVYGAGDAGNPMKFIPVSEVEFADYTVTGKANHTPDHKFTLWYTEPATTARLYDGGQGYSNWMEWSLPIGNGQLGASLFGGVKRDEIQINEKTLWSGTASSNGSEYGQYENFGSVFVENIGEDFSLETNEGATDYYRSLDLADALGKVSFKSAKSQTEYTREYFASNPDKVIVARYTAANGPATLNLRFTLQSGNILGRTTNYSDGSGYFSGNTFSGATQTVKYALRFKVVNTGGTLTTDENGITVTGATEVKVVISGATDFDPASPTYVSGTSQLNANLRNTVNEAAAKSYAELKSAHLDDYHALWNRMSLELSGTQNTVPTNTLIDTYNSGADAKALMLENLYFAYGRYLEIASSRGVALPSNLQGIWSNMDNPAWNADIHSNINVQMNYWPAEQTNLSEMHEPFLNYIINMAKSPQWQGYATAAGQSRGWTCYTENNIFGGVGSFMHNYVIANAWYCTHLWQHYRYTLDTDYLKRAFPAMLSAAQFWMDRLVLVNTNDTEVYVCPNEYSPEHGPASENGVAHAQQLVYDLFDNTLAAIRVLGQAEAGISDADLDKLKDRFNKLDPGLATETYDGTWNSTQQPTTRNGVKPGTTILREWKTSTYKSGEDGHRHMSHLMCLYPFSQVTPGTELYNAAVNSLRLRGDGATGWSMGWKINLWARAKDGDHSRTILNNALAHSNGGAGVFYNLFDSHAPFQIDGNFGACAGMAEMIMQSHSDTIEVLPALPTAWANGTMTGMKAVGNFTVDITWANNKATSVRIVSHKGQPLMVKADGIAKAVITKNGDTVPVAILASDVVRIPTDKVGDVIVIDFTQGPVAPEKGVMEILTDEGFGTFYSDRAIVMPAGVQGITVEAVTTPDNSGVGLLQMQWKYNAGAVVPAGTGLLIKGAPGSYEFNYSNENPKFSGTNFLEGQMEDALISGVNKKFYKLTYSKVDGVKTLGFFYGAPYGAAFVSKAGKAWLAVPTGDTSARGYRFDFGTATGIQEAQTEDSDAHAVYTLDGRRVNRSAGSLTRGIYIVGGKKIMVK